MTTFDASLDYWAESANRLGRNAGSVEDESEILAEGLKQLSSLRQVPFIEPSPSVGFRDTHPRFFLFVLANLIIWPLLAYVGYQIKESHAPGVITALMVSSGSKTISAADLVTLVKSEHKLAYWIKPVAGDSYANNSTVDGVNSISYMPSIGRPKSLSDVNMTIKTYRDIAVYNAQLQPLAGPNETVITTAAGTNVEFNEGLPDRMIVTFLRKAEIVVVQYPTTQDATILMRDAAKLTPIS